MKEAFRNIKDDTPSFSPPRKGEERLIDPDELPKTTGEKYYDVAQFLVGKAWIMAFTAVIAFMAHPEYGKDTYLGLPNIFKKLQKTFHQGLLHNSFYPLAEHGEGTQRVAGAAANALVLLHGGNIFAPAMKTMENGKERIANYFNRRYGKPGEVEIAHERLKDEPKQTWGDVLKGRIAAFAIVFSSFTVIDQLLGKNKDGHWAFDKYEDTVGRWIAGMTKEGRKLGFGTHMAEDLSAAQKANRSYRFGKIVALDVFATTAAILIWNAFSRSSAKKRHARIALQGNDGAAIVPFANQNQPGYAGRIRSEQEAAQGAAAAL